MIKATVSKPGFSGSMPSCGTPEKLQLPCEGTGNLAWGSWSDPGDFDPSPDPDDLVDGLVEQRFATSGGKKPLPPRRPLLVEVPTLLSLMKDVLSPPDDRGQNDRGQK